MVCRGLQSVGLHRTPDRRDLRIAHYRGMPGLQGERLALALASERTRAGGQAAGLSGALSGRAASPGAPAQTRPAPVRRQRWLFR